MPNNRFDFKQFYIRQSHCSQKVTTDACLFGAWTAAHTRHAGRILDIGAGTGLLSMMLAQKLQGNIDGIEIDADCANQMQENVQASPWIGRITCMQGDARHHFFEGRYGLIVSNPPFHESQLQSAKLSRNLAWHSSELTLAELFNIVDALLEKGGQFSLLLPYYRLDEAMTVAAGSGLHASMLCRVRHSNKHPFTRVMLIYQRGVVVLTEQTMEIRDGEDYSADFASLLKDYYLFL